MSLVLITNTLNPKKNDFKKVKNVDWSRNGGTMHSSMHSIASYLAMFTPALPEYFINRYSQKNNLVMDPFSGRGTTALKAREMQRRFVGSDLNPYALALSYAKIVKVDLKKIIARIDELRNQFNQNKTQFYRNTYRKIYKELLIFYTKITLAQLIFLRKEIGQTWDSNNSVDKVILGIALGLMHGPQRKNKNTIYFSVTMPNTISMSPNYVQKFIKKNNLILPKINVFDKLKNRLISKFDSNIMTKKFDGKVLNHNALHDYKQIKNNSVNLVITSPPYLNIVNYTNSNWIKLWLLGYERKTLKHIKLFNKANIDKYTFFIQELLQKIYPKIIEGGKVCLVVGDVRGKTLIEDIWKKIKKEVNFKYIETFYDEGYRQEKKVTNMLNSKKGQATIIEKVIVLEKRKNDK